jgi:ferritin-like metal-binding protein YciE
MEDVALNETIVSLLISMTELEKKCAKVFSRLSIAAHTPELAKALHEEQTDVLNHVKRLKLIGKLFPKTNKVAQQSLQINSVKFSKKKTVIQDIEIIFMANQLLAMKNNQYDLMLKLLNKFNNEDVAVLIKQTINDNENTLIWINRTLMQLIEE